MKSFQFAERNVTCGSIDELETLLDKAGKDTPGTVVDLRTFLEASDALSPKPPEGWGYRRLPLTGATITEQDLDVFRREFFRKGQTVVVAPNSTRAELMIAASVARNTKGGWEGRQRAEGGDLQGESRLLLWLTEYLVRHGFEEAATLEAVRGKVSDAASSTKTSASASAPVTASASSDVAPGPAVDVAPGPAVETSKKGKKKR